MCEIDFLGWVLNSSVLFCSIVTFHDKEINLFRTLKQKYHVLKLDTFVQRFATLHLAVLTWMVL